MIKRILLTLLLIATLAYVFVAVMFLNKKERGQVCSDISLTIDDTTKVSFISKKEVLAILQSKQLNPVGKKMTDIQTSKLERVLKAHPLIQNVECYKTPGGKVLIEFRQRIPIVRIIASNGESYFVDNNGEIMPFDSKCVTMLPIVTGNVDKSFAKNRIFKFALFLQKNSFWNSQIEQINVLPDHTVELIPRVGQHSIYMGTLSDYENKLDRLKEFYERGLNKVGWNKYSRLDVEFSNQIICKKRNL